MIGPAAQAAPRPLIREAAPGVGRNDVLLKFDGGVPSEIGARGSGDVRGRVGFQATDTRFALSRASSFNIDLARRVRLEGPFLFAGGGFRRRGEADTISGPRPPAAHPQQGNPSP
jgi:hypothetical protein